MIIEILTLFPEMFPGVLESSIIGRAQTSELLHIRVRNIRDYTTDKHHVADDAPYGGGPGMVMKPEPLAAALDAVALDHPETALTRVYLTPEGEVWNQALAEEFARLPGIVLVCGHYEGIDERIRTTYIDREVSSGDYVLTGGELPAMMIADSIARLIPGVVGNEQSIVQESFGHHGLLDHPHYTRPEKFRGMGIPEMLLSGHHKNIDAWRREQSLRRTFERRPDLVLATWETLSRKEQALVQSWRDSESEGSEETSPTAGKKVNDPNSFT